MKLSFKKIEFRNFLSFGNNLQTFKFEDDGLFNITGINRDKSDDDNRNRNGLGKSSLFNCIFYALYGEPISSKISMAGLVNNINKKNLQVTLWFDVDGVSYRIERGRKPEYFRFYKGETDLADETLGEQRFTQEKVNKLIGITPDLFCQTVLLTCQVDTYMNMKKLDDRRAIIEQVLGFDAIVEKVEKLKELNKNKRIEIDQANFEYETTKRANEQLRATLNNQYEIVSQQSSDWKENRKNKISELKNTIETLSKIDFDKEIENITAYEKYLKDKQANAEIEEKENTLKSVINSLSAYDFDKEIANITLYDNYKKELEEQDKIVSNINVANTDMENTKNSIELLKNKIEKLESINLDEQKEIFSFNDSIKEIEKQVLEIRLENSNTKHEEEKAKEEVSKLEKELANLEGLHESLKKSVCPTCGQPLPNAKQLQEQNEDEINEKKTALIQAKASVECYLDRYRKEPNVPAKKQTLFATLDELMNSINELDGLKKDLSLKENELKLKETEIANLMLQKHELIEVKQPSFKTIQEVATLKAQLDSSKEQLEALLKNKVEVVEVDMPPFKTIQEVATLKVQKETTEKQLAEIEKDKKNPFEDQIKDLMKQLESIEDVSNTNIVEMELELEHQEMLLKLLNNPKSSVRQAILEKSIAFLNQKVKDYLIKLNSDIYVEFKTDMSVEMAKNGLLQGYASSGEEGRIALALQFAFRDTWECLNGIHPNILMVDEVIDRSGLDEAGVDAVIDCLLGLNDRTRYIVSHNQAVTNKIHNIITIEKKGNFSYLV